MKEEIDIDEEFNLRYETATDVMKVVSDFFLSLDFYNERVKKGLLNNFLSKKSLQPLLLYLSSEAWNVLDKMKMLNKMVKDSPIRVERSKPFTVNISKIKYLTDNGLTLFNDVSREDTDKFLNMIKLLTKELRKYECCQNIYSKKNLIGIFEDMKQRYRDSHPNKLSCYMEDVFSVKEAIGDLRRDFKHEKAVSIWHDCGRDIKKTFETMIDDDCIELDLLPLLQFTVKYDMLHDRLKEFDGVIPNETYIAHYHSNGSINIENIEHVGKLTKEYTQYE